MSDRYPVYPKLDGQSLSMLIPLIGREKSKVVPIGNYTGNWDTYLETESKSTSVYSKLGIGGVFAAETNFGQTTTSWDAMVGLNSVASQNHADRSCIIETFWGIGIRVILSYSSAEASGNLKAASIAAEAEYRGLSVQYEIQAIGLGPNSLAEILETIPPMGRFDMNSWAIFEQVRTNIVKSLMTDLEDREESALEILKPVVINLAGVSLSDELDEATDYRYTMKKIAEGHSLEETILQIETSGWTNINESKVRSIYEEVLNEVSPGNPIREIAQKWLSTQT